MVSQFGGCLGDSNAKCKKIVVFQIHLQLIKELCKVMSSVKYGDDKEIRRQPGTLGERVLLDWCRDDSGHHRSRPFQ